MVTKEELEHLEKTPSGDPRIYCETPTIFHHLGIKKQKERYGRSFTRTEAHEFERQFRDAVPCDCGELMYSVIQDMTITNKKTGKRQYFPSEQFWICEKCNIKMIDCNDTSVIVRTMLDAGVGIDDAINIFDKMEEYEKKHFGRTSPMRT